MMLSNRLVKHFGAAAAAATIVGGANAAVVAWNINQVVPNTSAGLYVNVEAQTFGSSSTLAGWDLNPWGTSTTTMSWFGTTGNGCVQGLGQGGTTVASASLSLGTVVSSASTFANTASSVTAGGWVLNSANYFGFRFNNAAGQARYGYGIMTIGATMGVRTMNWLYYEDTGGSITVVPAPGAMALVGLAGLAARRRRR
jgi:MYXO-CTERM domain-containing protein